MAIITKIPIYLYDPLQNITPAIIRHDVLQQIGYNYLNIKSVLAISGIATGCEYIKAPSGLMYPS